MKTFKLCSLSYAEEGEEKTEAKVIPLIDGLIINKEDEGKNWIIEALMDESEYSFFEKTQSAETKLKVKATITSDRNRPVRFSASVRKVDIINSNAHVLFDAFRIERPVK